MSSRRSAEGVHDAMSGFLLVYHRKSGQLEHFQEFRGESGPHDALRARFEFESRIKDPDVEIVALNSDSEATIRVTHARYFAASASAA